MSMVVGVLKAVLQLDSASYTEGMKQARTDAVQTAKQLQTMANDQAQNAGKLKQLANVLGQNSAALGQMAGASQGVSAVMGVLRGAMGGPLGLALALGTAAVAFAGSADAAAKSTKDWAKESANLRGNLQQVQMLKLKEDYDEAKAAVASFNAQLVGTSGKEWSVLFEQRKAAQQAANELRNQLEQASRGDVTDAESAKAYASLNKSLLTERERIQAEYEERRRIIEQARAHHTASEAQLTQDLIRAQEARKQALAAVDAKEGAADVRAQEQAAKAFESLQQRYASEEQLLGQHLVNEMLVIQNAEALKIGTQAEWDAARAQSLANYHAKVEQMEAEHQARKNANVYAGLAAHEAFATAFARRDLQNSLKFGAQMLSGVASQNRALFEVHKAFSLAQAAVSLPSAIMQSFEKGGGYPLGLIPAGLMAAQGAALISSISSSSFGGGASIPSVGGGGSPAPAASSRPIPPAAPAQEKTPQVTQINLGDDDQLVSTGYLRRLMERIRDEKGDTSIEFV